MTAMGSAISYLKSLIFGGSTPIGDDSGSGGDTQNEY